MADCGSLAADAEKPFDGGSLDPIGVRGKRKREEVEGGDLGFFFLAEEMQIKPTTKERERGGWAGCTYRAKKKWRGEIEGCTTLDLPTWLTFLQCENIRFHKTKHFYTVCKCVWNRSPPKTNKVYFYFFGYIHGFMIMLANSHPGQSSLCRSRCKSSPNLPRWGPH